MIPDRAAAIRARCAHRLSDRLAAVRADAGLPRNDAQTVRAQAADSGFRPSGQRKQDQHQKRHHAAGDGPAQYITALVARHQASHEAAYNHQNGKMHSVLPLNSFALKWLLNGEQRAPATISRQGFANTALQSSPTGVASRLHPMTLVPRYSKSFRTPRSAHVFSFAKVALALRKPPGSRVLARHSRPSMVERLVGYDGPAL